MTILERFLKYVSIPTTSDSSKETNPSTENQRVLAKTLVTELQEIGVDNLIYNRDKCYVYACLKGEKNLPKIGFIAHLDTSEDAKGDDIKPRFIKNYQGQNIKYPNGLVMSTHEYPDLLNHIGKTLIVTDGSTLLGADDKAGIAEIMSMLEEYKSSNISHGDIYVCFTPDEEIGLGTLNFVKEWFPVDIAFTVDGSSINEISYENFNAATATIDIKGISTHCGYAKDKMVNALLLATKINELLPNETPRNTEKYQGFYHLEELYGDVSHTTMKYLIRDFNKDNFEKRKRKLEYIIDTINAEYCDCIKLNIKDSYYNMKDYLGENFNIYTILNAYKNVGIVPEIVPIRGGTDGAELTYRGIPCPNLGTGGHNFHSVFEYIAVEDMLKIQELLVRIVREYSKKDIISRKLKK